MLNIPVPDPEFPAHPPIRSFGTRRGHMTTGQRTAFETLQDRYALPLGSEPLDVAAVFGNEHPVVLEIGCGMGETTAQIAAANPGVNYLAVEVYPAGLGALMGRLQTQALNNVRVLAQDAVLVLNQMIAPGSLAGVHIFFPDPWPKKRHHKRRLVQPGFVSLLATRLAPGGTLHCATDWLPYAEQMLSVLSAEPLLRNTSPAPDPGWYPRPAWRPLTKFERRGLGLGHPVHDLIFARRG